MLGLGEQLNLHCKLLDFGMRRTLPEYGSVILKYVEEHEQEFVDSTTAVSGSTFVLLIHRASSSKNAR